jgi:hypothetical protein
MKSQAMKMVKWSSEDGCYVGTCPSLFYGGVHGNNEAAVYRALCRAVASCSRSNGNGSKVYRSRIKRYSSSRKYA